MTASAYLDTLPTELLIVIFRHLYTGHLATSATPPYAHPLASVRLVCQQWNTIVIQTPEFWTTVWIASAADVKDPVWQNLLAQQLEERSGNLPLDIVINSGGWIWNDLALLVEAVERWRSLTLTRWGVTNMDKVVPLPPMPNLEELDIDRPPNRPSHTILPINLNTPKLMYLRCTQRWVGFVAGCHPPLKRIDVLRAGVIGYYALCQSTDTLEDLSLDCSLSLNSFRQRPTDRLSFQALKRLRVTGNGKYLLSRLQLPQLHSLDIEWHPQYPTPPLDSIPSLQVLRWRGRAGTEEACLAPLLVLAPNICAFSSIFEAEVDEHSGTGGLSPFLEKDGDAPKYCPLLEEIHVQCVLLEVLEKLTEFRPLLKVISMESFVPVDYGATRVQESRQMLRTIKERVLDLRIPHEDALCVS